MTIDTEEVRVAGDWAFARGTYTYTMVPKEKGATIEGTGKWLSIFEKQDDGSWKMTRDCYNDNAPSAPPK
jgi:ketosteroid isomerase-like protein